MKENEPEERKMKKAIDIEAKHIPVLNGFASNGFSFPLPHSLSSLSLSSLSLDIHLMIEKRSGTKENDIECKEREDRTEQE